jgi:DNA-directed RNA polymerase specialized sigma24 family protein
MMHPDQKYIDALIHNNVTILEELYQKFSGKIKWMVLQNNGSEADAGDVFQDALLAVYRRARTGNFMLTCPFEAFFYTVLQM